MVFVLTHDAAFEDTALQEMPNAHVHANFTRSKLPQAGLHEQYGGVKPDVARDAHASAICSTVDSCFLEAGISPSNLTAVAVTVGPGLSLCLQVWICFES